MTHPAFQRIGIICDYLHPETPTFMPTLIAYLHQHHRQVVVTENTKKLLPDIGEEAVTDLQLKEYCDLLIAVGGDGSLLRASMIALDNKLPILGINRGHLGFLTSLPANQLESLATILNGDYIAEDRLIIEAKLIENNQVIHSMRALNDIVLTHAQATHMLEFDVYSKEQRICHLRADGYIVATPTGSTAYALSAGGPIVEPQTNALALVPMFPHSLSNRPLVVSANHTIDIRLDGKHPEAIISADGQVQHHFDGTMHCQINQSDNRLQLIHGLNYHFFTNLSEKLSWHNSTKRN